MWHFKRHRRESLRAQPFPDAWRAVIERNVDLFHRLSADDQRELLGHTSVLLAEKHFEGCGGLELTDEIRVTIAVQAAVLLLHRETDYYPRLTSILIYPTTYVLPGGGQIGEGGFEEQDSVVLGHTAPRLGALVLAWDAALHGARHFHDGVNVVFHEFAHQLDFEDFVVDGTPVLDSPAQYSSWTSVLGAAYDQLRLERDQGQPSFLNQYGATNPTEFFAVATESFFERPGELLARHALLYGELRSFYRQDPAQWNAGPLERPAHTREGPD